jgi:hypothetical protein
MVAAKKAVKALLVAIEFRVSGESCARLTVHSANSSSITIAPVREFTRSAFVLKAEVHRDRRYFRKVPKAPWSPKHIRKFEGALSDRTTARQA